MLTTIDYDLLILRSFEALKREIDEAEQYTIQHYNQLVAQQKKAKEQNNVQQVSTEDKPKATTKKVEK
ncbi:hypothetical protein [uncultured Clostridium sp.]|uniref:hypothetical protein n=1 Tax=uncultured Clostridium sp. TaxID=59620 RepID=UPI00261EDF0D|nr:hypothetical protein [uncultured Clostridium sp.]